MRLWNRKKGCIRWHWGRVSEEGFVLKYAMPDMNVTTGQEKPEEDPVSVLTLAGRNFQEIEEVYNRSQEKISGSGTPSGSDSG